MSKNIISVLASALVGAAVLSSATTANAAGEYDKMVAASKAEVAKMNGVVKISLDWPKGDAKNVIKAFQKDFPYIKKIDYKRETGVGPFGKFLISFKQGEAPPYDVMHIASEFQQQYVQAGAFRKPPFSFKAVNKSLPSGWPKIGDAVIDPKGMFISTTGNARGIIYNPNLVKGKDIPTKWSDCANPKWKGKVMVDARNKWQAYQHDPKTRDKFMKLFAAMVKNGVVIQRGQGGIVNKVAAGEYPIACGINYHTAYRTIERKGVKTLKFTFGESVPLEIGTRLFVPKWSKMPATAQLFSIWAATEGQKALGKHAWRGFTWNEKAHKYKAAQGKYIALCQATCGSNFEKYNREYQEALKIPVAKKKKK